MLLCTFGFARTDRPVYSGSMIVPNPAIGSWYQKRSGNLVKVVALDLTDSTIEIQHYDGTVEELEVDQWPRVIMTEIAEPEDWHGSVDVSDEDFMFDDEQVVGHPANLSALDYLDRVD